MAEYLASSLTDIKIEKINNSPQLLDKLRCLDIKYRHIEYWPHLAGVLRIPKQVKEQLELYQSESPSIKLFEHLEATQPHFKVAELKSSLWKICRVDLYNFLAGLKDDDKVSEVITSSRLLVALAKLLDGPAYLPTGNWEDLALELGVSRNTCKLFKTPSAHNPSEMLFEYLQTAQPNLIVADITVHLKEMKRNKILLLLENVQGNKRIIEVLIPGSSLFIKITGHLNSHIPGLEGCQGLGHRLGVPTEVLKALKPPDEITTDSPTMKMLVWLASNRSDMTVEELVGALEQIQRIDAVRCINSHFKTPINESSGKQADDDAPADNTTLVKEKDGCTSTTDTATPKAAVTSQMEPDLAQGSLQSSSSLMHGIQETTSESPSPLPSGKHGHRFPREPTVFIGRDQQRDWLVKCLARHEDRMVVVYGPSGYGKTTLSVSASYKLMDKDQYITYVNSRHVNCVDDLANKILKAFGHRNSYASRNPVEQTLALLESFTRDVVLIIENLDKMLHMFEGEDASRLKRKVSHSGCELEAQQLQPMFPVAPNISSACTAPTTKTAEAFKEFIADIMEFCPRVCLLVTSWERVDAFGREVNMKLDPLTKEESIALLQCMSKKGGGKEMEREKAEKIAECCDGYPLLLCGNSVEDLPGISRDTSAEEVHAMLDHNTENRKRVNHCLDTSFKRMPAACQDLLLMLSVFPENFTVFQASMVTGRKMTDTKVEFYLNTLTNKYCFSRYDSDSCTYTLHSVVRRYGIEKGKKPGVYKMLFESARKVFIEHFIKALQSCDSEYFSSQSQSAVQSYRIIRYNIRQIIQWCIATDKESTLDKTLKLNCIDVFIDTSMFLIKVMTNVEFQSQFSKLADVCESQKDKKRQSELCVYRGVKNVINCTCYPKICPVALCLALRYFEKALTLQMKNSASSDLRFQRAKVRCYSARGRCLVRKGNTDQGLENIKEALAMCGKVWKKSNDSKDQIMLSYCYAYLAVSKSYTRKHYEAIRILRKNVVPICEKVLNGHPLTATIYNYIASNYFEVGEYREALEFHSMALESRQKVLGDHPDTARSLFEMGITFAEQGHSIPPTRSTSQARYYEAALGYFWKALDMQQRVLDTPEETMITHQQLAVVLTALGRHQEAEKQKNKITECVPRVEKVQSISQNSKQSK